MLALPSLFSRSSMRVDTALAPIETARVDIESHTGDCGVAADP